MMKPTMTLEASTPTMMAAAMMTATSAKMTSRTSVGSSDSLGPGLAGRRDAHARARGGTRTRGVTEGRRRPSAGAARRGRRTRLELAVTSGRTVVAAGTSPQRGHAAGWGTAWRHVVRRDRLERPRRGRPPPRAGRLPGARRHGVRRSGVRRSSVRRSSVRRRGMRRLPVGRRRRVARWDRAGRRRVLQVVDRHQVLGRVAARPDPALRRYVVRLQFLRGRRRAVIEQALARRQVDHVRSGVGGRRGLGLGDLLGHEGVARVRREARVVGRGARLVREPVGRHQSPRRVGRVTVGAEVGGAPVHPRPVDQQADPVRADQHGLGVEVARAELAQRGQRAPPPGLHRGRVHAGGVLPQQPQVGLGQGEVALVAGRVVARDPVTAVLARACLDEAAHHQVGALVVDPPAAVEEAAGKPALGRRQLGRLPQLVHQRRLDQHRAAGTAERLVARVGAARPERDGDLLRARLDDGTALGHRTIPLAEAAVPSGPA